MLALTLLGGSSEPEPLQNAFSALNARPFGKLRHRNAECGVVGR